MTTHALFSDDAYLRECAATVVAVEDGAVVLDRTVFYAQGGGQPGDTGTLLLPDGGRAAVRDTRKAEAPGAIRHLLAEDAQPPPVGERLTAALDWQRRLRLMRAHTALHLLCAAVGGSVTGGQVGEAKGRLDFDLAEGVDKEALAAKLNAWVAADHPVRARWIDADELAARPELVRTMSVRPPTIAGRVRLVEIEAVDLQACGGTHVASTAEIGRIEIGKVEKKGRQNRRVNIVLAD